MGFSEELVKNRKKVNLTQEALAEKCDVSRQAVAKWEKGESLPDVYQIAKLANLFQITIEELIWSTDKAITENKKFYIRVIEEADKRDFALLMREHKYLGRFIKLIDKLDKNGTVDDFYWPTYFKEEKTYVVRSKEQDSFIGYIYFESIDTYTPQMTMQFYENTTFAVDDFIMIRNFLNFVQKEYGIRALHAYVNSKIERDLFSFLGYQNVKDEVMLALPI